MLFSNHFMPERVLRMDRKANENRDTMFPSPPRRFSRSMAPCISHIHSGKPISRMRRRNCRLISKNHSCKISTMKFLFQQTVPSHWKGNPSRELQRARISPDPAMHSLLPRLHRGICCPLSTPIQRRKTLLSKLLIRCRMSARNSRLLISCTDLLIRWCRLI